MEKKFHTKFIADFLRVSGVALACVAFANCSDDKVLGDISRDKDDVKTPFEEAAEDSFNQADQGALLEIRGDENDVEGQRPQEIAAVPKFVRTQRENIKILNLFCGKFWLLEKGNFLTAIIPQTEEDHEIRMQLIDENYSARVDVYCEPFSALYPQLVGLSVTSEDFKVLESFGEKRCRLAAVKKNSYEEICNVEFVVVGSYDGDLYTLVEDDITNGVNALLNADDIDILATSFENIEQYEGNSFDIWKKNRDIYAELNLRFEGEVGDKRLCWGEGKQCIDVKSNLKTVVEVLNRCNKVFGKCPIFPLDRSTVDLTGANALDSFRILQSLTEINGRVVLAQRGEKRSLGISGDESSFVEMSSITADGLFDFCKKIKKENSFDKLFGLQDLRNSIFIYGKEQWGKRMQRERRQFCL